MQILGFTHAMVGGAVQSDIRRLPQGYDSVLSERGGAYRRLSLSPFRDREAMETSREK